MLVCLSLITLIGVFMSSDYTFKQLDLYASQIKLAKTEESKGAAVEKVKSLVDTLKQGGVFEKRIDATKLGILNRVEKSLVEVDQGIKSSYFRAGLGVGSYVGRNLIKSNIKDVIDLIHRDPKAFADVETSMKAIGKVIDRFSNPSSKLLLSVQLPEGADLEEFEKALECLLFNGLKMNDMDDFFITSFLSAFGAQHTVPGKANPLEKSTSLLLEFSKGNALKTDVLSKPNVMNAMSTKILETLQEGHDKRIGFLELGVLKELINEELKNVFEDLEHVPSLVPNSMMERVVNAVLKGAVELEKYESQPAPRSYLKRLFTDSDNASSVSLGRGNLDVFSSYAENSQIYDRAIYDGDRLFGVADGCEHIQVAGVAAQKLVTEMGSEDMKLPEFPTPANMDVHYAKFVDKFKAKDEMRVEAQSTCLYGQKKTYNQGDPHLNELLRGPGFLKARNMIDINDPQHAKSATFVSLLSVGDCGCVLVEKATGTVIPLFDPEPEPVDGKPSALPQMDPDQAIIARTKHFLIGDAEKYTILTFSDGITDGIPGHSFQEKCDGIQKILQDKIESGKGQATSEGIHRMIKDAVVKNTAVSIQAGKDLEKAGAHVQVGYETINQLLVGRDVSNIEFKDEPKLNIFESFVQGIKNRFSALIRGMPRTALWLSEIE